MVRVILSLAAFLIGGIVALLGLWVGFYIHRALN